MPDKNLDQPELSQEPTDPVSSPVRPHKNAHHSDPNAGTGDPTDGRKEHDWKTKYPNDARGEIRWEASYLWCIFFLSHFVFFAIWVGWVGNWLSLAPYQVNVFKKFSYYAVAGMIGGVTFGMKYFYRVLARGYWHQDRRIWRLMSPFLSMTVALFVGIMIDASIINSTPPSSGAAILAIGFLSGYFADQAVAKMYEIAEVVFGKSAATKAGNGK